MTHDPGRAELDAQALASDAVVPAIGGASDARRRRRFGGALTESLAAIALGVMMLHVVANALTRTFAATQLGNTLQITAYWYLPTLAMLGIVAAQARDEHVTADLLFRRFSVIEQRWGTALVNALAAIVSLMIVYYSGLEALDATARRLRVGVTSLTVWPFMWLVPSAFLTVAGLLISKVVVAVRRR